MNMTRNKDKQQTSIFASIFGPAWSEMPPVFRKHYANRAYTHDVHKVEGALDILCRPPLLWMAPLMKLLGHIPPVNAENVPVTVTFQSDPDSSAFHFNRIFHFAGEAPYEFRSRMLPLQDDLLVEIMPYRIGWKLRYAWDGEKVMLLHCGYVWLLFGRYIPLPLTLLLGKGYAEEHALSETVFAMQVTITHPLWGKIYEYKGRFEVVE